MLEPGSDTHPARMFCCATYRVFLAVVDNPENRGAVVAAGGGKVSITPLPSLAFPNEGLGLTSLFPPSLSPNRRSSLWLLRGLKWDKARPRRLWPRSPSRRLQRWPFLESGSVPTSTGGPGRSCPQVLLSREQGRAPG